MQAFLSYLDHGDVGEQLSDVVCALRGEGSDRHEHLVDQHAQCPQIRRIVMTEIEDQLRR